MRPAWLYDGYTRVEVGWLVIHFAVLSALMSKCLLSVFSLGWGLNGGTEDYLMIYAKQVRLGICRFLDAIGH